MLPPSANQQRLEALEEILELEYEKLGEFQKEIAMIASAPAKFELKQRLKREVIPEIRKYEAEYGELLSQQVQEVKAVVISDAEAESAITEVVQAVQQIEIQAAENYPEELIRLLTELREKLDDPGKSAAAKLKVALPIIPLVASYELEMDTEAFMTKAWRKVKSVFKG